MFEAQVAYYLNEYLGQYVEGIDQKSLTISIYEGNVVLKNLQLKPDALAELDLPVTVKAGLLGSLTLKVPWASLGRVPVDVSIDRLYVLVEPREEHSKEGDTEATIASLLAAFQRSKLQRVARQEAKWIRELTSLEQKKEKLDTKQQAGDGADGSGGGAGFLRGFIDTIIGNLQLSITNVHVRYEDAVTRPGHPFACGLTLDRVSGSTVDELGQPAFVTTSPLDLLRKALHLRRIAIYFDCDVEGWRPGRLWRDLAPSDWETWFQPGVAADVDPGSTDSPGCNRHYVLQPVDGRALYTRRGRNVHRSEDEAASEFDITLDAVAVALTQAQYHSYSMLLAEVSVFTARLPHMGFRPKVRPSKGEAARVWWRYTGLAVKQQMEARRLNWHQVLRFAQMRKEYVPLYLEHLRQTQGAQATAAPPVGDHSEPTSSDDEEQEILIAASLAEGVPRRVAEMDAQLPECTIMMFRRLSYTEFERERRRAAKAASEAERQAKTSAQGGGGWLGWLMGSAGGGGAKSPTATNLELPPAGEEEKGQQRAELSPEEYARLIELVTVQEEGLKLGIETPHSLLTQFKVKVGSASAVMKGPNPGDVVLKGSLEGITVDVDSYPVTTRVQVGVTAMGVDGPEGVFIQTGAQAGPQHSHDLETATSLTAEFQSIAAERALAVSLVQRPQDNSADAILDVILTPSYVYYTAATVDHVAKFFAPPDELKMLDFSGLSAAATTQLEKARRTAAEYAAAALSTKPRLKMRLALDAPKVAVPIKDARGEVSLALDLGRFVIESDHETAAQLPAEEAGLYECIKLRGSNVSAYLVDGAFDWAKLEEDAPAAGPGTLLIPLLDRCGMDIGLQAARYAEPRLPRLRLSPVVPLLHFHLSPGRIGRLLRVINAALPSTAPAQGEEGEGQEGAEAGPSVAWRLNAEREGPAKLLSWTGIGRSSATWQPRHAVLYQGKLYFYDSKDSDKLLDSRPVWPDRIAVRVPPDMIGGCPHVVAIRPADAAATDLKRVAEDASSTVLRFDSEAQAGEWYRALLAEQQSMQEKAGGAAAELPDWEVSSSAVSSSDVEGEMSSSSLAREGQPPGHVEGPNVLLQIDAKLGEFAIFASGREPVAWWPPDQDASSVDAPKEDGVRVDGEVALVVLRASGGSMGFSYGAFGMTIHTALSSLDVLDALVGRRNAKNCFLASSSKPDGGAMEDGDDIFFDASTSGGLQRTLSGKSTQSSHGDTQSTQDLAEFTLSLRRPGTKEYEGVDTSLDATLGTLYFFCNRPTVAALITLGLDVSAAASAAFQSPGTGAAGDAEGTSLQDKAETGIEIAAAADAGAMDAAGERLEGLELTADAPGRKMFAMSVTLRTLQVVFNYEGRGDDALAEACMTDFSFALAIDPDGGMQINSALGNITAVDCTLEDGSPHRQACGLREGSTASLVALAFASHPAGHTDPRVPPGLNYYTLQAKLSELQIIFLYRFLQEILQYISVMLALRLAPEGAEQVPEALPATSPADQKLLDGQQQVASPPPAAAQQPQTQQAQQQQPFVLVMDIEMNAPVISLPRSSDSTDGISVDLGNLHLRSTVDTSNISANGTGALVEVAELTFSGVECSVVQAGRQGPSVIRNPEQGWQLRWRRPLVPECRGEAPFFDMALHVPFMKASITDTEYLLMTSVAAANFAEVPKLPSGASWVAEQHVQDIAGPATGEASADEEVTPPQSPREGLQRILSSPRKGDIEAPPAAGAVAPTQPAPSGTSSQTKIRVVVSLGEVELELKRTVEGLPQPLPLARFTVDEFYVAYRNAEDGSMHVVTCVPKVEIRDMRPEVPVEQSLVISSGHKASFLMLEWGASPGMTAQTLGITLQKPLFVAELGFLLNVTQFVVPNFSFVKSTPLPFVSMDILLTDEPYKAERDIWLSPSVRLLADAPGTSTFEFDGCGHRLVLPSKEHLDELLPLVIIGASCTLHMRNVTIVHADTLPACLQLAAGARMIAQPNDGVKMVSGAEALKVLSPKGRGKRQGAEGFIMSPGQSGSQQLDGSPGASSEQAARSISITFDAVGAGLQLVQIDKPSSAELALRGRRSAGPSAALSRSASNHPSDLDLSASATAVSAAALRDGMAAAAAAAAAPRSVRVISATMDLSATLESKGLRQHGSVRVQGLRAETRTILDIAKVAEKMEKTSLAEHKKVRGRKEDEVLRPCSVFLEFDLLSAQVPGEEAPQVVRTDVTLETSEIRAMLSPGTLELGLSLSTTALAPLMQPGPDAALRASSQFERVWSFDPVAAEQKNAELAVSLAATGIGAGVTVWRPQTATGYGVTGHIITPGEDRPTFEVLTVAVNSGIAAYPASYSRVWSVDGATIWRPVAPEGYVAMGDVLVLGDEEPELSEVLCLHESTVVEVPVGECISLPPVLPHAPAVAARAAQDFTPVDLWCVDNTMGTFIATTSEGLVELQGRDLRSPLGLTPAALLAQGAAVQTASVVSAPPRSSSASKLGDDRGEPVPSQVTPKLQLTSTPRKLYDQFQAARRQKRNEGVRRTLTPMVVDFRRIWSDGGAFTEGEGLTAWRPVAPPGYAALGDCIMKGFNPPASALVVLDTGVGGEGLGQAKGMPLVKAPRGYDLIWHDGNPKEEMRACFWRPIPHPGYVAMGCVATIGTSPPRKGIKCLHADAAVRAPAPRTPIWSVSKADKLLPPLSLWTVDEALSTFSVEPSDRLLPPEDRWRIKLPEPEELTPAYSLPQHDAQGVNVVVKTGSMSVLLFDALKIPLLEVETSGVEAGIRGPSRQVTQAYLGLRPGVFAYNRSLRHWEPVVEPVDIIAKCDANLGSKADSGIDPGVSLSIKSSAEMVYTTLALAHATALLTALAEWRSLHEHAETSAIAAMLNANADAVNTNVVNALGIDAAMELDYGDRMEVVSIGTGQKRPVLRPLAQLPLRRDSHALPRDAIPHDLLLVDVDSATGDGLTGQRLYCAARLEGAGVDGGPPPTAGVASGRRTRGVVATASDAGSAAEAAWHERLAVPLPSRPAAEHALIFDVWNADAGGGKGAKLGSGTLNVAVKSLDHRKPCTMQVNVTANGNSDGSSSDCVCVLNITYMLQNQWRGRLVEVGPKDDWTTPESTKGQRALSLSTIPGTWAVIPTFGQQRASSGESAVNNAGAFSSITALKVGAESVILEGSLVDEEWHEVLRAPCQVVNSTELLLEVGLLTKEDGDWEAVAKPLLPSGAAATPNVLGRVEPGKVLPLPLNWRQPGSRLVFRPVLDSSDESAHDWSLGDLEGIYSIPLDEVRDDMTRLLHCPPTAASSVDTLWFSLTVDSDELIAGKRNEALTDWRLVISPPLVLVNQLPLPGSIMVWEGAPGSHNMVERMTERVGSGERIAVHTADVRRPVSFTLYLQGYDWAETSPAVLTSGVSGEVHMTHDRARIVREAGSIPVEVFIQRDFQMGAWLLESKAQQTPSDVVAQGVPLAVTLLAPLWIVNATSLAIDAAVVQVPPPPTPKRQSAKAKPHQLRATGGQGSNALRVLKTSDVPIPGMPPAQDPTGSRTIVPNSLELLSYPMPSFMAAGSSQDPARAAARQHYGVRLRVANSGWTNPLALDTVEVAGTSPAAATPAVGNLQNAQPVLLRAEVRENNVVYEVIARLEVTAFKNSQVLRLEPHVVVTNRTAVPLQLLQCRTAAPAPLAAAASGVVVVPEGGVSFTYGASRGINALPVAGPGSHLMRPSMRSAGSLARLSPSAVSVQDSLQQHGSMSSAGSQAWLPVPSAMSARSLVQLSGNSMRSLEQNGAILDLPAGASAVPLHLIPGLQYHVLCFRYAGQLPGAGTVSTAQGLPLWSRPLHLQQDREEQHYVVIPVAADNASAQSQLLGAEGVALLRLTMHTRGAGAMHIVLESVNSEPPFLLENRTPFPVQYRQADIPTAPFHTLEPMSAVGYAWEYSLSGVAAPEIEFQEGLAVGAAVRYQLESPEGGDSGSNGVARCRPLPLSVSPHQCTVRVGFAEAVATNSEGVVAITGDSAGGALGRGGIERVLQLAPGRDSLLLAGLKGLAAPPPDFHATFELPGVEVSLIDDTPMEILLLTVTGLKVVVASGLTPVGPYRSVRCSIGRLQLDNQLPGARFPVAFSLAKNASSSLPQLSLMAVTQVAGMRGRTFFPFIGAHSPDELQLAVAESLVWRVAAVADTVMQRAGAGNAGGPDTAAADIPVRIRLLNVPDIGCNVSFLGEPLSRPRHMAGGVVSLIIDLASFQAAPVTLHGLDMSNISTSRSAFFNQIFQIIQGELFGITLSLVRNFGVIGGASKVLGILSAGVAKLAGDRRASGALGQEDAPPQQTPQRSITDVGDGLLEGAGAFGSSLLRGFKGLVEKPMQGAKQSGVEGAFRGMAKGLVGVVATPVSGALDALSATAEGFDASFGKSKEELLVVERRRLPRVIGGDGKLQPILREGSDREANIEQLGQALLRATLLAEASSLAQLQRLSVLECYEEHFVLPGDAVAILTNRSLLLVFAPGFATLDGAAEVGALATVDVPAGRLQWRVSWSDLLAMELRWSSAGKYPDRIVVHRRGLPGVTESQPLANLISCFPDTPQASQIKLVAGKVLRKYYQDPARKDQQWSERHEARARLPADQPPEHLPLTLPSLGFTPTWHTNPARAPVVYFWRAEAPSGYKPVGDVATLGDEPPLHPVPCFRDDSTLQAAAAAMLQGTSFDGSSAQARPVAVPPEEFTLIWRYNGPRAVTMWMPVAPPGYKALGAVVLDGPNVPSVDDYLCVREDLCRGTNVFDSPIWAYDPAPVLAAAAAAAQQHGGKAGPSNAMVPKPGGQTHQPETWKVTVWPVDSRLGTFLVVRGLSRPPQEVALTVAQVEDKPGRLLG